MSERKFDIVFDGSVINGSDPLEVKAKVRQLFKLDEAAADRLFTGTPIVIKKSIDRKMATQFQNAMNKAGARVQLVMHKASGNEDSAPGSPSANQISKDPQNTSPVGDDSSADSNKWTVAEANGPLLQAHERPEVEPITVNTDHISLEEGNKNPFLEKLDASEKQHSGDHQPSYPAPNIENAPDFALKEPEQIESEIDNKLTEKATELAENKARFETDFGLAEAGADLLAPHEKVSEADLEIDLSHFSLSDPV